MATGLRGVELTPDEPLDDVVRLGPIAEAAGFDAAFVSAHYNNRDPFTVLDRIAARTDGLRVGPGVANPYETHPVSLASRLATLDEASDGRAIFGLGAGDRSTLTNLGVDRDRPLRRVLETMRVARRLFAGERVTHDGTFTAANAALNYTPPGSIPIYVGAQGPHMLRMAAKHADGALVNASHPADIEWARGELDRGLDARAGDRGAFEAVAFASASVAADPEAARDAARPPVAFIAGGADDRVLDRHGINGSLAARIGDAIGAGEFRDAFDAVSDRMLDAFCVAGTPGAVADRIDALLAHADGIVLGSPLGPDRAAAIDLLAEALDASDRG